MNWTVDNNGAWDYAADTRGYTVGGMAEYDDRMWSLRYGLFAMPTVANGIDMDWAFSRAHGQNGEFELRHSFVPQRKGTAAPPLLRQPRPHGRLSRGGRRLSRPEPMQNARTSCSTSTSARSSTASATTPSRRSRRICASLAASAGTRASTSPSFTPRWTRRSRPAATTPERRWHRPVDKIGLAVVSNAIKRDHQNYLK